jgi:hypothetical protein
MRESQLSGADREFEVNIFPARLSLTPRQRPSAETGNDVAQQTLHNLFADLIKIERRERAGPIGVPVPEVESVLLYSSTTDRVPLAIVKKHR